VSFSSDRCVRRPWWVSLGSYVRGFDDVAARLSTLLDEWHRVVD
jgi:hypothetical protein